MSNHIAAALRRTCAAPGHGIPTGQGWQRWLRRWLRRRCAWKLDVGQQHIRTHKTRQAYRHWLAFHVHARHMHTKLVDVHALCRFDLHVTKTSIRNVCYGFGQEQELVHGVRKTHLHFLKPQICGGTSCAEAEPRRVAHHSVTSARTGGRCIAGARRALRSAGVARGELKPRRRRAQPTDAVARRDGAQPTHARAAVCRASDGRRIWWARNTRAPRRLAMRALRARAAASQRRVPRVSWCTRDALRGAAQRVRPWRARKAAAVLREVGPVGARGARQARMPACVSRAGRALDAHCIRARGVGKKAARAWHARCDMHAARALRCRGIRRAAGTRLRAAQGMPVRAARARHAARVRVREKGAVSTHAQLRGHCAAALGRQPGAVGLAVHTRCVA